MPAPVFSFGQRTEVAGKALAIISTEWRRTSAESSSFFLHRDRSSPMLYFRCQVIKLTKQCAQLKCIYDADPWSGNLTVK
jgi:hypothetical protein